MPADAKHAVLKQYFGYSEFRPGQEDIIDALLGGRDVLGVMPTGAGKSICYQVPALLMPGVTLVISPLISLMKDQVSTLTAAGVRAAYINSSLTPGQQARVLQLLGQGTYKIVYVAPERLEVPAFLEACSRLSIDLVAVDEAHCVSQWGQDFRPSYLKIIEFIRQLPGRPVVGAFTATATRKVRQDIADILQLQDPYTITTGFDRPNLYFGVIRSKNKTEDLLGLLEQRRGQSGIIYCSTRKAVEEIALLLPERGIPATRYHAGLPDDERRRNQDSFIYDRTSVMVATNAFGMGIDKSNVSFVIHYNMPKNIESYYQEAGRAGRDGNPADCILLYSPQDVRTAQYLILNSDPNPELDEETQAEIRERDLERLKFMMYYCTTTDCLRGYILRYFNEKAPPRCENCSNCTEGFETVDITVPAQKLLSCIARTGQRYGAAMIADILHGSQNQRLLQLGLNTQTTYGLLSDLPLHRIRRILDTLEMEGMIRTEGVEFPVLQLTARAAPVLRQEETVTMRMPLAKVPPHKAAEASVDSELLTDLKRLRSKLAAIRSVPSYVIFTDAALIDMCRRLPHTEEEFLEVSGVGQTKLQRYGKAFLEVIAKHSEKDA